MTTKCKITWAKTKSANARSGVTLNVDWFALFNWIRKLAKQEKPN